MIAATSAALLLSIMPKYVFHAGYINCPLYMYIICGWAKYVVFRIDFLFEQGSIPLFSTLCRVWLLQSSLLYKSCIMHYSSYIVVMHYNQFVVYEALQTKLIHVQ